MLRSTKAIYKNGQLLFEKTEEAPPDAAEVIVAYEVSEARGQRQSLYGIWKDRFPPDLDLDGALAEIRTGWQERLKKLA